MCGIAGASWSPAGVPISRALLEQVTNVLRHRGPDASGLYLSPPEQPAGAGLGHRRLSIIDLNTGGQPLANEDGSIWIVFNGEIYNYRELRPDLIARGHRFQTETDTEVIVHLYEEYGANCVDHLRGMFAFAIWDERRGQLFLARDRLGKKPLYYRLERNRLWFASELKALLQAPELSREIDPQALDLYLTYQYVPHPWCIFRGFRKLPPAHRAVFADGKLTVDRYWFPWAEGPEEPGRRSAADWREELRATLTEAVRLRLRSDVPLGAFLSGGVDSTIIAGLTQRLSATPAHTFSIGFPVAQFDERSYAREAAEHLGTNHHERVVEPSALAVLPRLIWHYDEPFSDSSAIPTLALSDMTREFVTVALSGDGGDELFAGYDRYRAVRLAGRMDKLPGPIKSLLGAKIWQKLPASVEQKSFRRRLKRFLAAMGESPERRYLKWIAIFDAERRRDIYAREFRETLGEFDSAEFILQAYAQCPRGDMVSRTTFVDQLTYLPGDILTKVDIASMSVGLEARSPFLDQQVAELAARMPLELKQDDRQGKKILVETFRELLPERIQRRAKMGFGVPLDSWFRLELRELLRETLLDSRSLNRGYFAPREVERLVEEHLSSQWDHSYRLWNLLCLELWHQTFADPASVSAVCPAGF